jgi:hypothetical protein
MKLSIPTPIQIILLLLIGSITHLVHLLLRNRLTRLPLHYITIYSSNPRKLYIYTRSSDSQHSEYKTRLSKPILYLNIIAFKVWCFCCFFFIAIEHHWFSHPGRNIFDSCQICNMQIWLFLAPPGAIYWQLCQICNMQIGLFLAPPGAIYWQLCQICNMQIGLFLAPPGAVFWQL